MIRGLQPHWIWQLGLVVAGVVSYYLAMLLVGDQLKAFRGADNAIKRVRDLSWIPYFTEGALAGVAGLLNPAGLFYVIASALPATLGANAGLLSLPFMIRGWGRKGHEHVPSIARSIAWIATAALATILFIVVLGRGVTWSRS